MPISRLLYEEPRIYTVEGELISISNNYYAYPMSGFAKVFSRNGSICLHSFRKRQAYVQTNSNENSHYKIEKDGKITFSVGFRPPLELTGKIIAVRSLIENQYIQGGSYIAYWNLDNDVAMYRYPDTQLLYSCHEEIFEVLISCKMSEDEVRTLIQLHE